jgi:type II secretory pathway predicted ATPase ExeA
VSYESYFRLREQPFSNAPDNRFFYSSQRHSEAMLRLMHAIRTRKGLAILEGGIGSGKTTLARKLLDELEGPEYEAALLVVLHGAISQEWLIRRIASQLGVAATPDGKVEIITALYHRLMELYQQGKKAVVLIDEAQMLSSKDLMEEIRGLLNLEVEDGKLVTFVLFGLPDLNQVLALDEPLRQRVAVRYRLRSFDRELTKIYIEHRLKIAGGTEMLFSDEAVTEVQHRSCGVPRIINTICDNALFEAYMRKLPSVSAELVAEVARDLDLIQPGSGRQGEEGEAAPA